MADTTTTAGEYREATREIQGLTAGVERRALGWLAPRVPRRVTPDHLTALGLAAMALAGLFYAGAGRHPWMLLAVIGALGLNWLGDSLDGTVARHRRTPRPRYGFYLDHVVDAFGVLFLAAGLGASGLMSPAVAAGLLIAYYLFSINLYLATHTLGRFKISYGWFGGTELRLLLALANLSVLVWPQVRLGGVEVRLFDLYGVGASLGLVAVLLVSVVGVAGELARLEPAHRTR